MNRQKLLRFLLLRDPKATKSSQTRKLECAITNNINYARAIRMHHANPRKTQTEKPKSEIWIKLKRAHKTVSFGSASILIGDDHGLKNLPELLEITPHRLTLSFPSQPSHENLSESGVPKWRIHILVSTLPWARARTGYRLLLLLISHDRALTLYQTKLLNWVSSLAPNRGKREKKASDEWKEFGLQTNHREGGGKGKRRFKWYWSRSNGVKVVPF